MIRVGKSARSTGGRLGAIRLGLCALLLLGLVFVSQVQPAEAANVADLTITEGQPAESDYGPIVGSSPCDCATPPGRTPMFCDPAVHCDVIDLTVNVPSKYVDRVDFWSVVVTLSWGSPSTNNMNLHMYDVNRNSLVLSSATANHPERVVVAELPSGKYYLVVVNESGANTGYKVRAELIYKGRIDEPFVPDDETSGSATFGGSSSSEFGSEDLKPELPTVPATGAEAGQVRAVQSPGPDGSTIKATLAELGVASGFKDSTTLTSMILGALATLIALAFGTVLFIRHRRSIYEEHVAGV